MVWFSSTTYAKEEIEIQSYILDCENNKRIYPQASLHKLEEGSDIELIFEIQTSTSKEIVDIDVKLPLFLSEKKQECEHPHDKYKKQADARMRGTQTSAFRVYKIAGTFQESSNNLFVTSISLTFEDATSYTKGFEYTMALKGDQEVNTTIDIHFFTSEGKEIASQKIKRGEATPVPNYRVLGYDLLGFRSQGSNTEIYQGEALYTSSNFYAVLVPWKFQLNYYVDNEIYYQESKYYMEEITPLSAPTKEGQVFVSWVGLLNVITKDLDVYALYKKDNGEFVIENEIVKSNQQEDIEYALKKISSEKIRKSHEESEQFFLVFDSEDKAIQLDEKDQIEYLQQYQIQEETKVDYTFVYIGSGLLVMAMGFFIFYRKNRKSNGQASF